MENAIVQLNKYPKDKYNVLVPVTTMQVASNLQRITVSEVQLDVRQDSSNRGPSKDIYYEKSSSAFAITKVGGMKLAAAANISIVDTATERTEGCQRCIEMARATGKPRVCGTCEHVHDVAVTVTIRVPEPSGGFRLMKATKEIDCTLEAAGMKDGANGQQFRRFLPHRTAMAESKAFMRAIRAALGLAGTYAYEELKKPFIVARVVPNLDAPEIKQAVASNYLQSMGMLFEMPTQASRASLPAAQAAETVTPYEDEGPMPWDEAPEEPEDMKTRLKENTWATKDHIIRTKLLPYFGKLKMCNITAQQIITWQNEMLNHKDENGKPYSPVYLKTVHNQLSAIFNHAVRYYNLRENPCKKAGSMGKKKNREMMFWTKEQYLKFAEVMMDKPLSFYAFEMLYWCGIREGELLALTPADFDFEKRTVSINKSYQRLNGQDLITTPKTEKSNRIITMPQFLAEEIQDYIKMLYGIGPNDRMFTVTKSYLHREMDRGAKEAGVPRIRIHDIRHSAVSLLIDMGFSATAIADRVGHESIDITYNYAHLFPSKQAEMADKLNMERSN